RLLEGDADDLGELLLGHFEAEPALADAAGDPEVDEPGQLPRLGNVASTRHGAPIVPMVMLLNASMARSTTGVPTTIKRQGNMNIVIGIASRTGRRAARSS